MAETRKVEVTFKGNPIELVGPKLKAGDSAPDFTCVGAGLAVINLDATAGKPRLFNVVPSLDTPVCSIQTKRFSEEVNALGDKVTADLCTGLAAQTDKQLWFVEAHLQAKD